MYGKAKPHRKGVIAAAAENGPKHVWEIQFDSDEEGATPHILRSQQLLRIRPHVNEAMINCLQIPVPIWLLVAVHHRRCHHHQRRRRKQHRLLLHLWRKLI